MPDHDNFFEEESNMAEKLYNRLIGEIQNYHQNPPALTSAYQRALGIEDVEVLKEFSKVVLQHFRPFVVSFPMWLGHIYGNCPDPEVRRLLLEDMEDEDKKDPHPLARDGHVGLHRRLLLALGATDQEIDDWDSFHPGILSMIHSFFEFARTYPWQEGAAAIMSTEMTNVREIPKLYPDQIELKGSQGAGAALMWTILKKLILAGALRKEDAAFLFAHDWTLLDELEGKPVDRAKGTEMKHVAYVLKMLVEHTPPEREDNVVRMFRTGVRMFWTYFDIMGQAAHAYLDRTQASA
jgi:pyrroloquinoline quinone (PQQ) biosynthesis protein C